MNLFRVDRFEVSNQVRDSFEHLKETGHKDGTYRLRKYSQVKLKENGCDILDGSTFNQSSEYNTFQGDMERDFEPVDPDMINCEGMGLIFNKFRHNAGLYNGTVVDIHQFRIITDSRDQTAQVSPEGVHQDGYKHICMIGIRRYNIGGGELTLSTTKTSEPFLKKALHGGEMITLRDDLYWHNGSPIYTIDKTVRGYQDLFVLTAIPVGGKDD